MTDYFISGVGFVLLRRFSNSFWDMKLINNSVLCMKIFMSYIFQGTRLCINTYERKDDSIKGITLKHTFRAHTCGFITCKFVFLKLEKYTPTVPL